SPPPVPLPHGVTNSRKSLDFRRLDDIQAQSAYAVFGSSVTAPRYFSQTLSEAAGNPRWREGPSRDWNRRKQTTADNPFGRECPFGHRTQGEFTGHERSGNP